MVRHRLCDICGKVCEMRFKFEYQTAIGFMYELCFDCGNEVNKFILGKRDEVK